jgi:hypothetical protein
VKIVVALFHGDRDGLHGKRVKRKDYGGHLTLAFQVELAFATAEKDTSKI